MIKDKIPEATEFHTFRVQPAPGYHYSTKMLRDICDIWEKYGSGLIALHGQSGDIMFQGIKDSDAQECFDELNKAGFDLGGAGATIRTSASCVGAARCEQACYDNLKVHEKVLKSFAGMTHRPELNYKFKFKFSNIIFISFYLLQSRRKNDYKPKYYLVGCRRSVSRIFTNVW